MPISPLTDRHPDLTIEDAYAIQSVNINRRVENGERICGRKIGTPSFPAQSTRWSECNRVTYFAPSSRTSVR